VSSDLAGVVGFLEGQKAKHAARFPSVRAETVLSFLGTTGRAGSWARVSIHRLVGVKPGAGASELEVSLDGALPTLPEPGDCLSVHLTRLAQFQGYQVKTRACGEEGAAALFEQGDGRLLVKGAQIYTVHHSPYTLRFFERIPFEEVRDLTGGLTHALVAVGPVANLSPRFVFHHEVKDGKLHLFHGDGLALKTYMNLRHNRQVTRLILDLDEFRGYALRGLVEEIPPGANPVAYEKVVAGFAAGNWSRPSRVFRFVVDAIEPAGPVGG